MGNYLGQHFLKNKQKLQKIVEAIDLEKGDFIIEIGPGKGALTIPLFEKYKELNCKIIAIEKDSRLAQDLRNRISSGVEIIEGDALKVLPQIIQNYKLQTINYKLVGNIPYYITGYLFRILGELKNKPSKIVLLIQREVAERVCAKPPEMNLLAASVQFWAKPEIISYVSRKDFLPPPKVESAIIKLEPFATASCSKNFNNNKNKNKNKNDNNKINKIGRRKIMAATASCSKIRERIGEKTRERTRERTRESIGDENYYKLLKILFKQPRKTILNNLSSGISGKKKEEIIEKLEKIGINSQDRPQNLGIGQIKKISEILF
ncbi:hypothetical protein HZC33_02775 [Candidatus Wolfebacteria bacterium]|nr:hypothetical protein [Candidatus Wolfebacteria bacterium]